MVACGGSITNKFSDGLNPLEENMAPEPEGEGPYPEAIAFDTGIKRMQTGVEEYQWVHSKAYIHADVKDVYSSIKKAEVVASVRQDPDYTFRVGVEPEFDHSIEFTYKVENIVDVEWIELWRYGVLEGDDEAPEVVIERHQKTEGSSFIGLLEGQFLITKMEDNVVRYETITHLRAVGGSLEDLKNGSRDRYENVVADLNGAPLPHQ